MRICLFEMDGILTGCDQKQEHFLPGWYHYLRKSNPDIPIAFGDLGLSEKARDWCRQRGELIPDSQIASPFQSGKKSETVHLQVLECAPTLTWFRKPSLMKQSPFNRTLWLDLDCQVLDTLLPLYSIPLSPSRFAVWHGDGPLQAVSKEHKETIAIPWYNGGVVLFEKGSPLVDLWERAVNGSYQHFWGDDQILSVVIYERNIPVGQLPQAYNWLTRRGLSGEGISILHWSGDKSKVLLQLKYRSEGLVL